MYETIKKFLNEGGKCLLIENGKPIGVVLTMEEYELLQSKSQTTNHKSQKEEKIEKKEIRPEAEKLLIPEINSKPVADSENPIGEAMMKENDFSDLPAEALAKAGASADITDIASADDITLEDLGLDELPY